MAAKSQHSSAAAVLGKRGAQKRWKTYSSADKAQLGKLINEGLRKKQSPNYAIANALFRLANKLADQGRKERS